MRTEALVQLLLQSLDARQVRALARDLDPTLPYHLPAEGEGASLMVIVRSLAAEVERMDLWGPRLFGCLSTRCPGWEAQVEEIRRQSEGDVVPEPAAVGPGPWLVPAAPRRFLGRTEELAALDAAEGPVLALVGLPGLGKRSLARVWAASVREAVAFGARLRADTPAVFDDDLIALGEALGVVESGWERAFAIDRVRAHLRDHPPDGPSWLVVVENASEPGTVELPAGPGQVVVTSQDRRWLAGAEAVAIEAIDAGSGRALLLHGLAGDGNAVGDADVLARALGHVPLALVQANAWCVSTGQTLAAAHERLHSSPRILEFVARVGAPTVARSWALAIDALSPTARHLLDLLAFLHPEEVPIEFLFTPGATDLVPEPLRPLVGDADALDDVVGELHTACLVERRGAWLAAHPLVQRVTRAGLDADLSAQRLAEARSLVLRIMVDPAWVGGWSLWRTLVPHAVQLDDGSDEPTLVEVLHQLGAWLHTQGRYADAAAYQERVLELRRRHLEPTHEYVAISMYNLGTTLTKLGRTDRSLPLLSDALAMTEANLGPEHADVATRLGAIAEAQRVRGEYAQAVAAARRACSVAAAEGADSDNAAWFSDLLAVVLRSQGDLVEARRASEHAVRIGEANYGADHPYVAVRRSNLAIILRDLEELGPALALAEAALNAAGSEAGFGPHHPFTALIRGTRGQIRCALGDAGGVDDLVASLAGVEAAMGLAHPRSGQRRAAWGRAQRAAGDPTSALHLLGHALTVVRAALGEDHPETADIAAELGLAELAAGVPSGQARWATAIATLDARVGAEHWLVRRLRADARGLGRG